MGKNLLVTGAEDPTDAVFGVTSSGEVYHCPLSSGPHWLICGTTGSGKSVAVNSMLISCMAHSLPEELIITWIDPKKVEATPYVGLPYCPIDPVTDMNDAFGLFQYLCLEMDRRYEHMERAKVRDMVGYNGWAKKNPGKVREWGLPAFIPYWILVVDEYADLKDTVGESIETPIKRLCQKARAAGIHVLIATQRPSVDVITGTIKANINSRICLKVADSTNSSIVLGNRWDNSGFDGSQLRGRGDALVAAPGEESLIRLQYPFIDDEETHRIFDYLREHYETPYPDGIDYKAAVVDAGMCEWNRKDEQGEPIPDDVWESMPYEKRHVAPKSRASRFGRFS